MAKYLLAYHGGGMAPTQADQDAVMAAWGEWFGSAGAAIIDPGNPVGSAAMIASDGSTSSGGGSNPITGYSILQADSLDDAIALAKGCPVLASGGSIQVAETFDVM